MAARTQSNCTFAWTPGSGGETLVNAEAFATGVEELARKTSVATPWGWTIERRAVSQIVTAERIVVAFYGKTTDATPPIPTGVQGTAVFLLSTGKSYTLPLVCESLSTQASNEQGESAQRYIYVFRLSGTTGVVGSDLTVTNS